jgi:anti-anti-sigma regulatory factor
MKRATPRAKTFTLPAILDFASVQPLKEALCAAVAKNANLCLIGTKVQRVTTPAVQALLSAAKTAAIEGGQMRIARPSPALEQAFTDLGLKHEFDAWRAR